MKQITQVKSNDDGCWNCQQVGRGGECTINCPSNTFNKCRGCPVKLDEISIYCPALDNKTCSDHITKGGGQP